MSVKNRFAATSEQDAEDQLKALYSGKPVRTGSTAHHRMTWFIKSRQVTMRAPAHTETAAANRCTSWK